MEPKIIRNIYCDESCHLQAQKGAMALGALTVPASRMRIHRDAMRAIKAKYGIKPFCEMKWVGISPSRLEAYLELVRYFFSQNDLTYRGLVVRDKGSLNHAAFNQTHDDWYYKMYFHLLNPVITDNAISRIYLDAKDTRGTQKVQKLHEVLCSSEYDFSHELIERVQEVRSHEVALMSLLDILTGALTYLHRGLNTSKAKSAVIDEIRSLSHLSLEKSTFLSARKVNIFIWKPRICQNV